MPIIVRRLNTSLDGVEGIDQYVDSESGESTGLNCVNYQAMASFRDHRQFYRYGVHTMRMSVFVFAEDI